MKDDLFVFPSEKYTPVDPRDLRDVGPSAVRVATRFLVSKASAFVPTHLLPFEIQGAMRASQGADRASVEADKWARRFYPDADKQQKEHHKAIRAHLESKRAQEKALQMLAAMPKDQRPEWYDEQVQYRNDAIKDGLRKIQYHQAEIARISGGK